MLLIVTLALLSVGGATVPSFEKYETLVTSPQQASVNSKYNFTGFKYVKFQVKGCDQVTLYIGKYRGKGFHKGLVPDIIVQFSTLSNYLVAENVGSGKPARYTTLERSGLLSCEEFREFYVKWGGPNGHMEVGTPTEVLMTLEDPYYTTRPVGPGVGPRGTGTWRIFNPHVPQTDCCYDSGNTYCVFPYSDCRFFTQEASGVTHLQRCVGLRFDTGQCVCNHVALTPCNV